MEVYVWEEEYDDGTRELKHIFSNKEKVIAELYKKDAEIDTTLSHGNDIVAWIYLSEEEYIKVIVTNKDVE